MRIARPARVVRRPEAARGYVKGLRRKPGRGEAETRVPPRPLRVKVKKYRKCVISLINSLMDPNWEFLDSNSIIAWDTTDVILGYDQDGALSNPRACS